MFRFNRSSILSEQRLCFRQTERLFEADIYFISVRSKVNIADPPAEEP